MSIGIESAQSVRDPKTGHFVKGNPAKLLGAGRKPGGSTAAERKRTRDAKDLADAMTAAALERMRADIEHMDERSLAQWAAKPALQLLISVVNDEAQPMALRMQAARDLLAAGWHKAPTASINVSTDLGRMSDQALMKLIAPQAALKLQTDQPSVQVLGKPEATE